MKSAEFSDEQAMFGFASDGTLIFVKQEAYDKANVIERNNPDYWLEQLVFGNTAVWTE